MGDFNTFEIEDKPLLSTLIGTEKHLIQQADGTYRHVLNSSIATQGFVNTVFITVEADFPAPVAGVITLAADTTYILLNSVSTANRIVLSARCGISAWDFGVATLTYTGTGTFLTGTTIDSFYLHEIAIFSTGVGATLFAFTGVPSKFPAFCIFETISLLNFANIGTITGCSLRMGNTGFIDFGTGLNITGSLVAQIIGGLYDNTVAATTPFITFSGTHALIQVKDCNFNTLASEEVLDIDAAIILTEGVITGNVFRNSSSSWFAAGSLDEEDVRFEYAQNGDAPESDEAAGMCISASAGTVIGVPGTFVKMAGTYNADILRRFTHSAGTLTYTGRKTRTFEVAVALSFTSSSNNRIVDLRIAKNGTSQANSNQRRKIGTGTDVGHMGTVFELSLDTGDTIEMQWSTAISTTTLTADFVNLIIK